MSFLAPYMLLGTLAAGIPIALHFFYRSRYRVVPWAAMKFLLASIEQTSRRLRFQELLLLILRVAVLLLLAFALSRPSTRLTAGAGDSSWLDAVDAVFVFDVSYSMAAKEGPATRLERAQSSALAVLAHLPKHSTLQLIACDNRAELLGPRTPSNLDQAGALIQRLEVNHRATDLLPGVQAASEALQRGQAPNKELYVFSDMQALGWTHQGEALAAALRQIGERTTIYLVRCGTAQPRNATVTALVPQSGIPHTGERAGFIALIRNHGAVPVRDLSVSLLVDGRKEEGDVRAVEEIAPGETKAVTLSGKLERPGLRVLTVLLKSDELEPDNRFDQVLLVYDQVRVLVVDGSPNDREPEKAGSYFLLHALRPVPESSWGRYHIRPRVVTPAQAQAALLAERELCILANVPVQSGGGEGGSLDPEFLEALADFVRAGQGLLIFGGDRVAIETYNRLLHDSAGLLPGKLAEAYDAPSPDNPLRFDVKSADSPAWLGAMREGSLERIGQIEVLRTLGLDLPRGTKSASPPPQIVLRYDDGRPAIVSHPFGDGRVLLATTSAEPGWSDWPIRPTFVPFVQIALAQLIGGEARGHNRTAGEPLLWRPPADAVNRTHLLTQPEGARIRLGLPERVEDRPAVIATDTPRAGVYWIGPEVDASVSAGVATVAKGSVPFAVVPDLRESENLESLSDQQLDERLGVPVIHVTAGDDAGLFAGTERLNREWTAWLLACVLALVLAEALLAWLCGRAW